MSIETRTRMLRGSYIEECEFHHVNGELYHYFEEIYSLQHPKYKFLVQPFRALYELYTPNSVGSHSAWKDFQHYKCQSSITNTMGVQQVAPVVTDGQSAGFNYFIGSRSDPICMFSGFGGADQPFNGLTGLYTLSPSSDIFISEPANLDDLKQRSLMATLPIVKAELSLVNSLIELRDFKSLPRTLMSLRGLLPSFEALARKGAALGLKKAISKWTARELLRVASDGYLQYAFNLKPLISDIRGIYTALTTLEKRLNRLVAQSAKTQVKHYTMPLTELTDSDDTDSVHLFDHPNWEVLATSVSRRQVISETSKFHFQIEYNYNYTQYQLEHARVLALLDSFGVAKLSTIVWNAIPWSFVVDWLIGVNRYISQFGDAGFMKPVINIHRCLWSIRRSRRIVCTVNCGTMYPGYPGYTVGTPASETNETAYRRQVWVPTSSSISLSGLTPSEFSLGAALVLSRRRPRRKR